MRTTDLAERIDAAIAEVAAAEAALEVVMRALISGARAEKVTIAANVEQALARVQKGRTELAKLREELGSE